MTSRYRYGNLDGLRGIAALSVMFYHFSIIGIPIVSHGYLAVDFFFILSGFILAKAYTDRVADEGWGAFLKLRLIRMLPLSMLGLLMGSSYFLIRHLTQDQSLYGPIDIILSTALNLFLIPKPWITPAPTDTIFPSNTPLWSLSLELLVNLIWARFFLPFNWKASALVMAVAAAFLCVLVIEADTADLGATWPTYLGGVARVTFGFFAGTMLWHYRPQVAGTGILAALPALALAAIFIAPQLGPTFDLVAILLFFPVIITFASGNPGTIEAPLFRFLGDISYPLYVIHVPVLMFTAGAAKALGAADYTYTIAGLATLVCLILSVLLDRLYDRPLRRIILKYLYR